MILNFYDYENNFDATDIILFYKNNTYLLYLIIGLYGFMCYYGPKIMNNYQPFNLNKQLIIWNGILSIFSAIGTYKTLPYGINLLFNYNFRTLLCNKNDNMLYGPIAFWLFLFIFSKIPELMDTLFIILKKKKIIFLHWYHHMTVLIYVWLAYMDLNDTGFYFVVMNYFVHSIMYGYYCLQSLNLLPVNFNPKFITYLQIIQMIIGTFICIMTWINYNLKCKINIKLLIYCTFMYSSYFYLFFKFALNKYIKKKNLIK